MDEPPWGMSTAESVYNFCKTKSQSGIMFTYAYVSYSKVIPDLKTQLESQEISFEKTGLAHESATLSPYTLPTR